MVVRVLLDRALSPAVITAGWRGFGPNGVAGRVAVTRVIVWIASEYLEDDAGGIAVCKWVDGGVSGGDGPQMYTSKGSMTIWSFSSSACTYIVIHSPVVCDGAGSIDVMLERIVCSVWQSEVESCLCNAGDRCLRMSVSEVCCFV